MAWFRIPRSLRTYLIVGLIITVAVLTFSTSKMLRVDATDTRSTFPFLMIGNKQHSGGITATAVENLGLDTGQLLSSSWPPRELQENSKSDIHTTKANLDDTISTVSGSSSSSSSSSISSISSSSGKDSQLSNSSPETYSDTIVISPIPATSSVVSVLQNNSSDFTRHLLINNAGQRDMDIKKFDTAKPPTQVQLYFPPLNSSSTPTGRSMRNLSTQSIEQAEYRRNFVKEMMKHAWHGYATYAWGYNELRPVSKMPHTESIFGGEKLGASIVDGIDTLYIMGLTDEYLAARAWIENNLDFNKYDIDLSVFETNIRYVGGLLSIYALTKDQMFLNKAVQIADKLLPAFDTPSSIPYSNINIRTGYARNHDWAYGAAILSEFGSMHLEFIYLSHVTGDPKYREKVFKVREAIKRAVPRQDGLYNNYINTETGQWLTRPTHISMGALGDSFYEYLIKAYVQSDGQDVEAYQMYMDAIRAYENKLIFTSTQSRLVYFAELKDTSINHKMDSLACFSGGMLALGAVKSEEPVKSRHMTLASGISNTCHEACIRSKSHLAPETFVFSNRADAVAYGPSEKYYILRPEILESYFYMWRFTHDPKYRAWAWDFIEALERYCKTEGGYSGLRNVYQPVIKDDVQQSFFFAEVMKYLYLIFTDDNILSFDDWVFNTEAHPLPILKQN